MVNNPFSKFYETLKTYIFIEMQVWVAKIKFHFVENNLFRHERIFE